MKEFVTQALVLGVRPRGGNDRVADLLTLGLGRVETRMVGGRAIVSKFSPHVDPLNLLTVRLVRKNRYTLADAIGEERFPALRKRPPAFSEALDTLFVLGLLVPKEEPDPRLFHEVYHALGKGRLTIRDVLPLLGYDPREARCRRCRRPAVSYFVPHEGAFLCAECSKGERDEVILKLVSSKYGT